MVIISRRRQNRTNTKIYIVRNSSITAAISRPYCAAFEITHECCHGDRVESRSGFGGCLFVDSAAAPTAKRFHHALRFSCSTAKKSCNAECK